jgi:ATP-binding cassette, subfamily B, multidrug efflux pump
VNLWRILIQYLKPHWVLLLAVMVFQFIQSMASLSLPTLNADIINKGVAKGDTGYILATGGLMLLIALGQVAGSILATYFGSRLAMSVGRDIRGDVFAKVGKFSERDVAVFGTPSLITRSTNDVQQVQMLVLMGSTMLLSAPILAVGGVIMALGLDVNLSVIMAVAVPVLLVVIGFLLSRMIPLFRLMQERIDRINLVLREQLTGVRVVRAFVRESTETARFDEANAQVTETALKSGRLMAFMFPTVLIVLNFSSIAVLWLGAYRVDSGAMEIGTVMAFLQYLMQILMAVMMSMFMAMMIPRAAVCADRVSEVMKTEPSVVPAANPVHSDLTSGSIKFDDVTFAYPGAEKPVLGGMSFSIPAGSTTAIIGPTGSGKTTLINLIARLVDPTEGRVLIDGTPLKDLATEDLWSKIGLIPQKAYLFSGTVADTLRYGREAATDEELWKALEIAQAKDFIEALPDGLNAPVVQGGTNFSGGQRQRLAIARALVKLPEVLIFDDSFSALDLTTDAKLRQALARELPTVTKIIVGQRVASIKHADQIVVCQDAAIAALGTHEELLKSSAIYQEIVASQMTAEEAAQ